MKTEWTMKQRGESIFALKNGRIKTMCVNEDFALHSILVVEGGKAEEFFRVEDGVVFMESRGK